MRPGQYRISTESSCRRAVGATTRSRLIRNCVLRLTVVCSRRYFSREMRRLISMGFALRGQLKDLCRMQRLASERVRNSRRAERQTRGILLSAAVQPGREQLSTYMELEPGSMAVDIRRCLRRWNQGDDGILAYARAYRFVVGEG